MSECPEDRMCVEDHPKGCPLGGNERSKPLQFDLDEIGM
jgi:hypothetical protein